MMTKQKLFVSDFINNGIKGHQNYEFVDVAINDDNRLFLDPILIQFSTSTWCQSANKSIQSFFDKFYQAYSLHDKTQERELLSHAREQNGTRFGYGKGNNGKGHTAEGLMQTFNPLEGLIQKIKSINRPVDLAILLPKFAEDGLSDLLTNILHKNLNEYTTQQLRKYGIRPNSTTQFWYWEPSLLKWKIKSAPSYTINNQELLLVPKEIVRVRYLFSIRQYFTRIILTRYQKQSYRNGMKKLSKQDILASLRSNTPNWIYETVKKHTEKSPSFLAEYHIMLPQFYRDRQMSSQELNSLLDTKIYGN